MDEFEFIFICTPTPTTKGKQDLSSLWETVTALNKIKYKGIITIRSTVLPGTCFKIQKKFLKLKLCHMPEFLRAKTAFFDTLNPDRLIISGFTEDCNKVLRLFDNLPENNDRNYEVFFTYKYTEMIKYACNCYLATSISFSNELKDICDELKMDYNRVECAMRLDKRLKHAPLTVTTERGFGGACFPKDTEALSSMFPNAQILKTIIKYNKKIRKK